MAINLSNYGISRTKKIITRELTNDESVAVNDSGLLISSTNGPVGVSTGTTLSLNSTEYTRFDTGSSMDLYVGTTFNLTSGENINLGTTGGSINITNNNILLNSSDNTEVGASGGGVYLNGDRSHSIQYNSSVGTGATTSWDFSDDINLGTTDYHYCIQKERVLGINGLFLDTSATVNSTTGGLYLNKQDASADTSGDWRLRIDESNNLIIENYTGALWKTKMKLTTG